MQSIFRLFSLFFFFLFVGLTIVQAQNEGPYYLSLKRELLYGGAGAGLTLTGKVLRTRTPDINLADLRLPNVSRFDRIATTFSSGAAAKTSDYTQYVGKMLPLVLLGGLKTRQDIGKIALLYGEVMLINLGLTDIIKSVALRPRPYVFAEDIDPATVLSRSDRASFLSGHTSGTAAGTFFFAKVFSDYYPGSKLKPYVWATAVALPVLTGYLRVRGGRHYPTDVIAGYALGATVGYLVPALHKKPVNERRFTLTPGGEGVYLSYQF